MRIGALSQPDTGDQPKGQLDDMSGRILQAKDLQSHPTTRPFKEVHAARCVGILRWS